MLTRIPQILRQANWALGLAELASQLDIDVPAFEGMLEQLVRQSRLRKSQEMSVEECRLEYGSGPYGDLCAFLTHGNAATRYEIPEA